MGEVTKLDVSTGPRLTRPGPIQRSHETSNFFCGHDSLDDWLKHRALKSEGRSSRTYVVCDGDSVVGYYCLATGSITREAAPGGVKRNTPDPIPAMIIGRLAVDKHFERRGIGSGMLRDALQRIAHISMSTGVRVVLVHALDQDSVSFYQRYGFLEYPGGSRTMFLPIETLLKAIA